MFTNDFIIIASILRVYRMTILFNNVYIVNVLVHCIYIYIISHLIYIFIFTIKYSCHYILLLQIIIANWISMIRYFQSCRAQYSLYTLVTI